MSGGVLEALREEMHMLSKVGGLPTGRAISTWIAKIDAAIAERDRLIKAVDQCVVTLTKLKELG